MINDNNDLRVLCLIMFNYVNFWNVHVRRGVHGPRCVATPLCNTSSLAALNFKETGA